MKVFIAGPRALRSLNKKVIERLEKIMAQNFTVLVGDAAGIDKQIQIFYDSKKYNNVKVFASNGKVRNNIGKWEVEAVKVDPDVKGFDFYAMKDLAMAKEADYGFMIWNGKSRGTFNNILNLVKFKKTVLVYVTVKRCFYIIKSMSDVETLKYELSSKVNEKKKGEDVDNQMEQLSLEI